MSSSMLNKAIAISENFFGKKPDSCTRFPTGFCAYVFHVVSENRDFVLKIYKKEQEKNLDGIVYWTGMFKGLDLKTPELISCDKTGEYPWILISNSKSDVCSEHQKRICLLTLIKIRKVRHEILISCLFSVHNILHFH